MAGGLGDDTYVVDHSGDRAVEISAAGGIDQVRSSASFTLGRSMENLTLTGADAIRGTGNEGHNEISGNRAANRLAGGGGRDMLTGGAGADAFLFNTAPDNTANWDGILDFSVADDVILLDRTIFTQLLRNGPLSASAFVNVRHRHW